GDRVCIVLDRATPEAAAIVAELWRVFESRDVKPEDVQILQPASTAAPDADPRAALPDEVRRAVTWSIHDPADRTRLAYLASVASGERTHLARDVIDAVSLGSVGTLASVSVIGYRGPNSVYFPGLWNVEAFQRAQGQGRVELGPDDERALRQMIDEIAWLLGVM